MDFDLDGAINDTAARYGVPANRLRAFVKIESGGNPRARTGSYSGLMQLSTPEFAKYGSGDIWNPRDNLKAGAIKLRAEAEQFKREYGRDPTDGDLYMIHQQGWGGAKAHWANPGQPAWVSMYSTAEGRKKGSGWAKQAIWGNVPTDVRSRYGDVDNITSRDFVDLWNAKVTRFGGDAGNTVAAQTSTGALPMVEKFGGAANTKGQRESTPAMPFDASVIDSQGYGVKMNRSKLLAAMLNKMAYEGDTPKSDLEGASRVFAAIAGAYTGSKQDGYEMEKRKAMLSLLGDQPMSPMVQYAIASGDPDLERAAIAAEFSSKKDLDAKSLQINDLVQQGVPTAIAHAIVNKAIVQGADGSSMDYTTGLKTMPDGRQIRVIPNEFYSGQNGVVPPPANGAQPAQPGVAGGGAAPPVDSATGGTQSANPNAPSIVLQGAGDGVIDPRNGGMSPPKEVTNDLTKEMAGQVQLDAALQDLADNIDPDLLGWKGRAAIAAQRLGNNLDVDLGLADPYQAKDQQMKIDQLFNTYRKYVTGAAAAEKELESLRQAFLNNDLNKQETFQALATLQSIGRRNYAINQALVSKGFTPGSKEFGEEFENMRAQYGMENTADTGRRMLAEAEAKWAAKRGVKKKNEHTKEPPAAAIPDAAIADLRSADTPENRAYFDQVFGAGAAARVLGAK